MLHLRSRRTRPPLSWGRSFRLTTSMPRSAQPFVSPDRSLPRSANRMGHNLSDCCFDALILGHCPTQASKTLWRLAVLEHVHPEGDQSCRRGLGARLESPAGLHLPLVPKHVVVSGAFVAVRDDIG